jgi:hypothetical protein
MLLFIVILFVLKFSFLFPLFIVTQVQNPATGDVIATVPCMDGKETADAISSAYSTYSCMLSPNFLS